MKRSRAGSSAGKAPAASPGATVQVPLPLLAVLADAKTAFFGLCLTAGQQVFQTLMEEDRAQLCGPKNVPNPDRQAAPTPAASSPPPSTARGASGGAGSPPGPRGRGTNGTSRARASVGVNTRRVVPHRGITS